jgi:uncharacterized damage-inducible protein DinB
MLTHIQELFHHMHWADGLVWNSVLKLSGPNNDSRLQELLYHIHVVQYAYLGIWLNQPLDLPKATDFGSIKDISQWGYEYHREVEKYLDKIDESSLEGIVNPPWVDRIEELLGKPPSPATVAQTMLQVVSHSTYHRGQVNRRLREIEGEPPLVDFISWIWLGKPQATWPEV